MFRIVLVILVLLVFLMFCCWLPNSNNTGCVARGCTILPLAATSIRKLHVKAICFHVSVSFDETSQLLSRLVQLQRTRRATWG